MFFCSYVLRVSGKSYRAHILLSIRFMVVNTIRFSTKVKCCKGNTEALHPTKKCTICTQIFVPSPLSLL